MKLAPLCLAVVAPAVPSLGQFGVSPMRPLIQSPLDRPGGIGGAIAGGDPLSPGDRPFLLTIGGPSVDSASGYYCVATLVAPWAVLTAASCFTAGGEFEPQGWVDVGRYSLTDDAGVQRFLLCGTEGGAGCDRGLGYIIRHPDFDSSVFENDFAVIILPGMVTGIEPVALNDDGGFPVVGADLLASGWGYQGFQVPPFSDIPLEATVNYISNADCSNYYPFIQDGLLCAGTNNRGSCSGDSGGPLIADTVDGPVQVGITSIGFCGTQGYPGAYSRVSGGYAWIMSAIQTSSPTASPTDAPTSSASPTSGPTASPVTSKPTASPSGSPTSKPTASPTSKPTSSPVTTKPSLSPTSKPTGSPTSKPTASPTSRPTSSPVTGRPTASPTSKPTASPTSRPTSSPTSKPTSSPTSKPTSSPTSKPTSSPVTSGPTPFPTTPPTAASPVTSGPTLFPTTPPTAALTGQPTASPTVKPTTDSGTVPGPSPTPGECPADAEAECLADQVSKRLAELKAVPSFEVVLNNYVYQCVRGDPVDDESQGRRLDERTHRRRLDDRFDDRILDGESQGGRLNERAYRRRLDDRFDDRILDDESQGRRLDERAHRRRLDDRFDDRVLGDLDARDLDRLADRLADRAGRSKRASAQGAADRHRSGRDYYY